MMEVMMNVENFVEFSSSFSRINPHLKSFLLEYKIDYDLGFMPVGTPSPYDGEYPDYIPVLIIPTKEEAILLSLRFGISIYKP